MRSTREIFGAAADKARQLALQLLEGKNLVDKGGKKVKLGRLG